MLKMRDIGGELLVSLPKARNVLAHNHEIAEIRTCSENIENKIDWIYD